MNHKQKTVDYFSHNLHCLKSILTVLNVFLFAGNVHAKRLPPPEVEPLTKGNCIYSTSYSFTGDWKSGYDFGLIVIESTENPQYWFAVPVYSVKLNKFLEYDVQWRFIKSMEFKNDEIITITNEREEIFEFNINTYEVNCISDKTASNVKNLYEAKMEEKINRNKKFKYKGIQPEKKKLSKIEDVIAVAEEALFSIYGEANIKKQMPYGISRYKNKWYIHGSLQEGWEGGVFEIVINAETSKIESVIHGK